MARGKRNASRGNKIHPRYEEIKTHLFFLLFFERNKRRVEREKKTARFFCPDLDERGHARGLRQRRERPRQRPRRRGTGSRQPATSSQQPTAAAGDWRRPAAARASSPAGAYDPVGNSASPGVWAQVGGRASQPKRSKGRRSFSRIPGRFVVARSPGHRASGQGFFYPRRGCPTSLNYLGCHYLAFPGLRF